MPSLPQSPVPSSSGGFPDGSSTGVPGGVVLSSYSGPLTITACGVVIDGKVINGDLVIRAGNGSTSSGVPCVTVKNSKINGVVDAGDDAGRYGPLVLRGVEISAPANSDQSAVAGSNFYLWAVNLHGGAKGGVQCDGYCAVRDSWIHDFYLTGASHYDAIFTNGTGGAPLVIDHNSLACMFYASSSSATGGCSANVGLFGDFSPVSYVTVTNNLFLASPQASYCLYGGSVASKAYPTADHVTVSGNVFQRGANNKCAAYGPVADWTAGSNTWSGNTWDDGQPVNP